MFGPNGALSYSGAELSKPTFFMDQNKLPAAAKELQEAIKQADCYLVVSPDYNHSIPPALASLMGHFCGVILVRITYIFFPIPIDPFPVPELLINEFYALNNPIQYTRTM